MPSVEVWYNPSCSKCVGARSTLDEARVPYRLRAYLDDGGAVLGRSAEAVAEAVSRADAD